VSPHQTCLANTLTSLARWESCTCVQLESLGWSEEAISELLSDYRAALDGIPRLIAEKDDASEPRIARALALAEAISRSLDDEAPAAPH
jgi:hypothetical protein